MKVTYRFVTGDMEIEVADEWGQAVMGLDDQERKNNRNQTNKHVSLDMLMADLGAQIASSPDEDIAFEGLMELLAPSQRDLLRRMYLEGETMASIARSEGVSKSAISQRVSWAYKKISENF